MRPAYCGVNLSGAEFGDAVPGIPNKDYIYPGRQDAGWFLDSGMNVVRIPFRWERLQPALYGELNTAELARLRALGEFVTLTRNRWAILDVHNYARYYDVPIGTGAVTSAAFADFWRRLAEAFKVNSWIMFGLMNEPHDMRTETWLSAANAAIAEIRGVGADQLILVPGNAWTGGHSWGESWYGTPNADVMRGVVDPLNNFAIEIHQYFDSDSSGNQSDVSGDLMVGPKRLAGVSDWLKSAGFKGFLAEFGFASDPDSIAAGRNLLDYLSTRGEQWLGWTYWSAGPWWGEYRFTAEPNAGGDRPQMDLMRQYVV